MTTTKTYAGLGSRKTPAMYQPYMSMIATALEAAGYTLRTSHAEGAAQAFSGATKTKQVYLPWSGFNGAPDDGMDYDLSRAHATVNMFHPQADALTDGGRKLQAVNAAVLAGPQVAKDDKVDFVIFWATGDEYDDKGVRKDCYGSTGQAIRLAYHLGIPTYNVNVAEDRAAIVVLLRDKLSLPRMDIAVATSGSGDDIKPIDNFSF